MRKYKKVKEKKVTYHLEEWQEVEKRAAALSMKTGTYIRQISVNGQITCWTIVNKVDKQKSKIYRKFTSA